MSKPTDPELPKYFGLIFIVAGIIPMVAGKATEGTPYWVAYLACSLFIIAGIVVLAQSFDIHWLTPILGPAIILIFAVIATWIGFAPGERECSGSINLPFYKNSSSASCAPFGFAAVFCWLLFFYAAYAMVTGKHKGPDK